MDIQPNFWVRVLLLNNVTDCTLKATSSFRVISDEADFQRQAGQMHFKRPHAPMKVEISAGRITISDRAFANSEIIICPDAPHIFSLNGDDYRGRLKLIINSDGKSFDAVNLVPLEPYLAGVVGAEMPDYWKPEALKAQAIAARTYCLYIKDHFGGRRSWDVSKTQASQVYRGVKAESKQIWSAVDQTYGQVLVCEHSDGIEDIFPTYYSAVCGGHTEDSSRVFGDSFKSLVGTACPYCKDVAKLNLFFWPMVSFDDSTVTAKLLQRYPKLKELGEIKSIIPVEKSDYGNFSRLTKIKLVGSAGKSDFLRAEDFRLSIDSTGLKIKSTSCRVVKWGQGWAFISGRGWGHGVGMCQYGAQGMAKEGKTAEQILYHYYPDSRIVSVY